MIFLVLRRKFNPVYYYKTADGREVDYIVRDNQGELLLIQVCESLQNRETKNREILALQTAMNELNLHFGLIITLHDEEEIRTDAGTIKCIPAWKMSLE
jgi:predicted AAA+ superfamily ATPase